MKSYLIVILPPKNITKLMNEYRQKYSIYTSYSIPPHITIIPPFFLKGISKKQLIAKVKKGLFKTKEEVVTFDSIDYFQGKNNVAYVKPDTTSSKYIGNILVKVAKLLRGVTNNVYDEYVISPIKFKPHMTISERIPIILLPKIKRGLLNFNHTFSWQVKSIFIFSKTSNSKDWKQIQEIQFN